MKSSEFGSVYRRSATGNQFPDASLNDDMKPACDWSNRLGELLHDRLTAPDSIDPEAAVAMFSDYDSWLINDLPSLNQAVVNHSSPDRLRASTALNFHRLSYCMLELWQPVVEGAWSVDAPKRNKIIRDCQDTLAIAGLALYAGREAMASQKNDYAYFDQANSEFRRRSEGIITEFDAALVILEFMKRYPKLTVVPAPAQFENQYPKKYNMDFMVLDDTGQAIGLQVKSSVRDEDIRSDYDSERIVLMCGETDFANILVRRTERGRYNPHPVGWAGIMCAQRVKDIAAHGTSVSGLSKQGLDPSFIVVRKIQAQELTRGIKPNLVAAAQRTGSRIINKMDLEPPAKKSKPTKSRSTPLQRISQIA